jgi:hypothetical protein
MDERDQADHQRSGRQQPRGAREPQQAVARSEVERSQDAVQQPERAVSDRHDIEPAGEEVDRPHAVLRGGVHQHRLAVEHLVGGAEEEVVVELDHPVLEPVEQGGRRVLRADDHEVRNGQRHQQEDRDVRQRPLFGWLYGLVGSLPGRPDLYDAIRRRQARSRPMTGRTRAVALAAGVALFPVAALATMVEVALRRGGTVYVEAHRG